MYHISKKIIFHFSFAMLPILIIFNANSQTKKFERRLDKPVDDFEEISQKKPESINTENKVTPYGLIQFNANTNDSTRSNTADFAANRVRFGMKVQGGIAEGRFEVQFNGNNVEGNSGLVIIRRADLTLKVLNIEHDNMNYTTSISMGGIRVGGAMSTAPDIAYIPNKYGRQDGLFIEEVIDFKNKAKISIGVGAFNHIRALKQQSVSSGNANWLTSKGASINSNWMKDSFSDSKGYLGKLDSTYYFSEGKKLNLIALYGMQNDAPSEQNATVLLTKVNDLKHGEVSLWYNDSNIFGDKGLLSDNGIAFWYEREEVGKKRNAIAIGGSQFSYDGSATYDDSQVFQLFGFSISGDTARYLTNMMQKKDRLTYATSYSLVDVNFGNPVTSTGVANPNYQTSQYSAYVGYAVNTFETGFNIAYYTSKEKVFTDSNGNLNKDNALKGYLTAFYKF
jgi:hypothetical protein